MSIKPILVVSGEPNSIFLEIFFKSIKKNKIKNPLILISSENILKKQMEKLKFKRNIRIINYKNFDHKKLNNKSINLINVNYNQKKAFDKISKKSNKFIENCFEVAFELIKKKKIYKLINGPISKKNFLKNDSLGMTEYISKKFSTKNSCMLIYNKDLSVCPITTHLPIKQVAKNINKTSINNKIALIDNFYKTFLGFAPKIGILGLNPHCESIDKFNEDEIILKPTINSIKKLGYKVSGPYPADTIFLKDNRKKFNVVIGMYHDQVLTPMKTLYEYDAINITLGLPFIRVSPDHGPNELMMGKNKSNPLSLIKALTFLDSKK